MLVLVSSEAAANCFADGGVAQAVSNRSEQNQDGHGPNGSSEERTGVLPRGVRNDDPSHGG
eukprot:9503162-Pyramimonas_sp.AAC.2